MPTLDSPEMMRAVIMDHYEYPRNKKLKNLEGANKVHMDSESCIDDIYIGTQYNYKYFNDTHTAQLNHSHHIMSAYCGVIGQVSISNVVSKSKEGPSSSYE